jgi:peptidoglycan/LPS O-acetylase OafA/YrhL
MSRTAYRPEIDGLRALAVLAVCLYHIDPDLLPGGFVGVDVFFAISGYLIASQVLEESKSKTLTLTRFYQRRIARIGPALITMAVATLVTAHLVYTDQDLSSVGASFTATLSSVANIKFMLQGNYFELSPDSQPFLHCWSLSVEEQFYLLLPLLLLAISRFRFGYPFAWLVCFALLSFVVCVAVTFVEPAWAFYLLPTRAWEMLAGCALAATPNVFSSEHTLRRFFPAALGLCAITAAFLITPDSNTFPGLWPLLPVYGALCVLKPEGKTFARTLLSMPILTQAGRMSYSLYLWHWPVFCFVDYQCLLWSGATRMVLKVCLTALLTVGSFWLIEQPARQFLNKKTSMSLAYAFLGIALAIGLPAGWSVRKTYYANATVRDVSRGGLVFEPTSAGGANGNPLGRSLVLMGDSTASVYGKALRRLNALSGNKFTVLSVAAGDPLPALNGERSGLWCDCLDIIRREKPDCVVVSCVWHANENARRLKIALEEMKPYVGRVIVLSQPPVLPARATREAIRNGSRPPFFEDESVQANRLLASQTISKWTCEKVSVVDVARLFEGPSGEIHFFDPEGRQLFNDRSHISGYGAELASEQIKDALSGGAGSLPPQSPAL